MRSRNSDWPHCNHLCETAWLKHGWHQENVWASVYEMTQWLIVSKPKSSSVWILSCNFSCQLIKLALHQSSATWWPSSKSLWRPLILQTAKIKDYVGLRTVGVSIEAHNKFTNNSILKLRFPKNNWPALCAQDWYGGQLFLGRVGLKFLPGLWDQGQILRAQIGPRVLESSKRRVLWGECLFGGWDEWPQKQGGRQQNSNPSFS